MKKLVEWNHNSRQRMQMELKLRSKAILCLKGKHMGLTDMFVYVDVMQCTLLQSFSSTITRCFTRMDRKVSSIVLWIFTTFNLHLSRKQQKHQQQNITENYLTYKHLYSYEKIHLLNESLT